MFAVILWAILIFGILLGVIVSGIFSIFLKNRARLIAIDALLVLSTLLIVTFLSANYLPKEFVNSTAADAFTTETVAQADLEVNGLNLISYLEDLPEPVRSIAFYEVGLSLTEALKHVEKAVQKLVDKYPSEPAVTSRLAIIVHNEGKNTEPVFEHYYKTGGKSDSLLESLRDLYSNPDPVNEKKYVSVIKANLPSDWYQQTALMDAYKVSDDAALKTALEERAIKSNDWRTKFSIYLAMQILVSLSGAFAIAWFIRLKKVVSESIPLTTEFRRLYACLISVLFAQVIAGTIVGFVIGFSGAYSHAKIAMGTYKFALNSTVVISGVLFSFFIFYMVVCRPQSISLGKAFTRSAETLTFRDMTILCAAGFCAMSCLSLIARLVAGLFPGRGQSSNVAQIDIVNAFFSGDALMICWSILLACFLAPVTEELLFRGLLFGWLRYKVGLIPAIIGSSVCFALWHFDLHGFWQYFGLGIVLSSIYGRTRNLWLVSIIHGVWNLWVMITVWMLTAH